MAGEVNGRLVEVQTKFHREAVRPGGVDRARASRASEKVIADVGVEVEARIGRCLTPLIETLRTWPADGQAQAASVWAATVRDVAGLVNRHLLTEVAMHTFDCLDAVLVDGASMDRAEAVCYAEALAFAQQELCKGTDLAPYAPLLFDLEKLTSLVINRARPA